MSRVYLLVEGQSEMAFVKKLLQPHYARMALYIESTLVKTSSEHRGGMPGYAGIKRQVDHLCKRYKRHAHVSTMFDLYALPGDFPGKNSSDWVKQKTGRQKAELIETCLAEDIFHHNFIPNIMVHEYEALMFVRPRCFLELGGQKVVDALEKVRQNTAPEDINDSPHTAPSRRILPVMPKYNKILDGSRIACDTGLDAMRADCPHFDAWLRKLEGLAG
ncbi:MAG: DUF4276 family protein [Azoarcus sp.]|jgi:hypothetical protein|nr:DUF4276 family protein [Azoarcus sp.]